MNIYFVERHLRLLQCLLFFIGLGLAIIYANNQILTGDQTQMLYKGYLGAYQNIWLSFGNAASAVGNVPGSFSALLVGLPLLLWDDPWSPMLLILLLRVVSFYLLDMVIKQVFSSPIRLLFMVLYWLNPWFLYDSILYNPAYLCFFTALHFWSAFKLKDKPSFIYSMLHVIAIGGVMQLHYSWPVLAVISCYLLYRKMAQPSWAGVAAGIGILLISLIPYFQEYAVNEIISRESDRYIGYGAVHVYPVIKAVLYWLRYGSALFSNRLISDINFDWLTYATSAKVVLYYCWQVTLYFIGVVTLIFSAKVNWQCWQAIKSKCKRSAAIEDDKQWLQLFAAAAVFAVIITAMLSPITFSYWHLILVFPLSLIPILWASDRWSLQHNALFYRLTCMLAIFFVVVNLVAANGSNKYSFDMNYKQQVEQFLDEQKLIPSA